MAKTAHTASSFMQLGAYTDSMNDKDQHTHIPRIYGRQDITFNSTMIDGGGTLECGICGMILYDNQS